MTYLYVLSRQQTAMDKIKYALFAFAMAVPVLLAAERAAQADSSEVKRRPKVGVVLSGGGAKGFAHLGAIKVMERAGIHIDYIGGTSIGAIVLLQEISDMWDRAFFLICYLKKVMISVENTWTVV